jgi:hypothetical protein
MQHRVLVSTRAATPWISLSILAAACGSSNGRGPAGTMDSGTGAMLGQPGSNSAIAADASGGAPASPPATPTGGSSGGTPSDSGAQTASDAGGQHTTPSGPAEAGAMAPSDGASSKPSTGSLPPISDPGATGPFTATTASNTGPNGNYMAFYPQELGQNGLLSPIVIWGNGATVTSPTVYGTLLNHIASHGFAVLAYNTTPQGSDMTAAIDWMVSENTRQGSVFYGTLDASKIAAMGHSAGSLATFAIANDSRLTTTMHLDGGTMSPHTDLQNLRKPAAFICGDSGGDGLITGDVARPNCDSDFMMATTAVWYGDVIGASHLTVASAPATDPKMQAFLGATAAWLRWQLASDETMKVYFVPVASCTFCTQSSIWTVQEKNF